MLVPVSGIPPILLAGAQTGTIRTPHCRGGESPSSAGGIVPIADIMPVQNRSTRPALGILAPVSVPCIIVPVSPYSAYFRYNAGAKSLDTAVTRYNTVAPVSTSHIKVPVSPYSAYCRYNAGKKSLDTAVAGYNTVAPVSASCITVRVSDIRPILLAGAHTSTTEGRPHYLFPVAAVFIPQAATVNTIAAATLPRNLREARCPVWPRPTVDLVSQALQAALRSVFCKKKKKGRDKRPRRC